MNMFLSSKKSIGILSGLKWHCTKCELKSGQAKIWQVRRKKVNTEFGVEEII
jgi:hypothetical protein